MICRVVYYKFINFSQENTARIFSRSTPMRPQGVKYKEIALHIHCRENLEST
jgi:hypothetical protein